MREEQQERKYGPADRKEGDVEWTGAKPRNLGPENHDGENDNQEEDKDQEEGQYEDEEDEDEEEEEGG